MNRGSCNDTYTVTTDLYRLYWAATACCFCFRHCSLKHLQYNWVTSAVFLWSRFPLPILLSQTPGWSFFKILDVLVSYCTSSDNSFWLHIVIENGSYWWDTALVYLVWVLYSVPLNECAVFGLCIPLLMDTWVTFHPLLSPWCRTDSPACENAWAFVKE